MQSPQPELFVSRPDILISRKSFGRRGGKVPRDGLFYSDQPHMIPGRVDGVDQQFRSFYLESRIKESRLQVMKSHIGYKDIYVYIPIGQSIRIEGLAQAFFYAGAKSVVASLWDVYDEQTTTFMEAFYRHLSSGKSKAEAVRAVKLDLLRKSDTSAPRHRAAFILMGEPDETVSIAVKPSSIRSQWFFLFCLMLSLVTIAAVLFIKARTKRRAL